MKARMTTRELGIVIVLLALGLASMGASCNPPPTLTTRGKQIWTATEIAKRVGELQNTVIQAEVTSAITEQAALIIVRCTYSVEKTLDTLPEGWQKTISTAWMEMKKLLPISVQTNPAIAAAFGAVDVILAEYGG